MVNVLAVRQSADYVLGVATADDLSHIPLFDSLDDAQLAELASWFDVRQAQEGTRLVGAGAPGYSFLVLADGSATVTIDGAEVATLDAGDFFGELAIIGGGWRSATVTASSPSRVLVLFGTEFRRMEHDYPEVAARIEARARARTTESRA